MGQQIVVNVFILATERLDRAPKVDCIPQDNCRDNQVETAGAMLLAFIPAVMYPAKAVKADGAGQRVAGFALVQFGGSLAAKSRIIEPIESEQRPLDAPNFAKRQGKAVLPRIGTKTPQHQ